MPAIALNQVDAQATMVDELKERVSQILVTRKFGKQTQDWVMNTLSTRTFVTQEEADLLHRLVQDLYNNAIEVTD